MLNNSKGSTVEIYIIMREGVKTFTQFNIWGVISSMQTCNIPVKFLPLLLLQLFLYMRF